MINRRELLNVAGFALAVGSPYPVRAQTSPKPLRLLVGYPPGGSTDLIARLVAVGMRAQYSPVIVDNRAGAGGRIALAAARQGDPSGSLLVITPAFPLVMFPYIYKKLPYDPMKDFIPVAGCAMSDIALCVGPGMPGDVRTLKELLAWVRSHPKQGLYGSPSAGSPPHFAGLLLARASGVELSVVNYKGGAPVVQDLLGGQIPMSISPVGEVLPFLAEGKLRVVATFGRKRSRFLPGAPTCVEAGFPEVVADSWVGAFAPARTTDVEIQRLSNAVSSALESPGVEAQLAQLGVEVDRLESAAFANKVQLDYAAWGPIIKASGFTAED